MKKLLKIIKYYDDLTFEEIFNSELKTVDEIKEITISNILRRDECSQRIRINVALYVLMEKFYDRKIYKIDAAIKYLSNKAKIEIGTVRDKLTRGLGGLSINEYKDFIKADLEGVNNNLKRILCYNIGCRTEEEDRALIYDYLNFEE